MTQFELWTTKGTRLLAAYENAIIAETKGKPNAIKAVAIIRDEILRRLNILDEIDKNAPGDWE